MTRTQLLLTQLAEEAAEVSQAVSKAIRFGLDSSYNGGPDNASKIRQEVEDLLAVYELLTVGGALAPAFSYQFPAKQQKVERYLCLSESLGILKEVQ